MDKIFGNPGKKLKALAIVVFILIFIAGCALSYCLSLEVSCYGRNCVEKLNIFGFIIGIVISAIIAYIAALILYAFGELVHSSSESLEVQKEIKQILKRRTLENASNKEKIVAPEKIEE